MSLLETVKLPAADVVYPSSYPIGALVEYPPEWMLDVLVGLYELEIRGDHGFGIRHPRARWLRLVVSSSAECARCFGRARWEDDADLTGARYCPDCAETEIVVHDAYLALRRARETEAAPELAVESETVRICSGCPSCEAAAESGPVVAVLS